MKPVHIFGSVVAIVLLGAGIWFAVTHPLPHAPFKRVATTLPSAVTPSLPERTPPTGMKLYRSTLYHFSFFYPDTLTATEFKEKGTALTVTFESASDPKQSFQIFIVPYGLEQITPERFKQDDPSGVLNDQQQITLDGKQATVFFSTNPSLGDTREIWFINHGFLYEVTTYKELDSWLAQIMGTWKFE